MKDYKQIFDQRGSAYDKAMQRFPDCRRQEFAQIIAAAELSSGLVVGDVPAGGGYLRRWLPPGCVWLGHEPCSSFMGHNHGVESAEALLPLPWADESVDVALSLAGIHHLDDKRPLFRELFRVVRSGGRLVVSDVATDSPVARFLDEYVGSRNSTGHDGNFLDQRCLKELADAGWVSGANGIRHFCWTFANRSDMGHFCNQLFDLRNATVAETIEAIESRLGVSDEPDGTVAMSWSLMTIVSSKPLDRR